MEYDFLSKSGERFWLMSSALSALFSLSFSVMLKAPGLWLQMKEVDFLFPFVLREAEGRLECFAVF